MKSIRFNTFETNSSSMHAVVVRHECVDDNSFDMLKTELQQYKKDDDNYHITITSDDCEKYTYRYFSEYGTFFDRLCYLACVLYDHYTSLLYDAPYDNSKWIDEDNRKQIAHMEYMKNRADFISSYKKMANGDIMKKFQEDIDRINETINSKYQRHFNDNSKIIIDWGYTIDNETNTFAKSAGCSLNLNIGMLYESIRIDFSEWLLNYNNKIMTGSDEASRRRINGMHKWARKNGKNVHYSFNPITFIL